MPGGLAFEGRGRKRRGRGSLNPEGRDLEWEGKGKKLLPYTLKKEGEERRLPGTGGVE